MTVRYRFLCAAIALSMASVAIVAHAEVQKFMNVCGSGAKLQLCPSYALTMTPPAGWIEDKEASRANKMQMIVPKGKDFNSAAALIYVKVFLRNKEQSLADFIKVSQDRWRSSKPDTKISEQPDTPRANGRPSYKSYAYENPSTPQQAFEVVSFAEDSDKDGNDFIVMVVVTGSAKKALEEADLSYKAFLRAH